MSAEYILYESATGYALFAINGSDQIGIKLDKSQETLTSLSKFNKCVELTAFLPFKTAEEALENINCISEGALHPTLQSFLEMNVPKKKKLGVVDDKLGGTILETLKISCVKSKHVAELCRGIRLHFNKFIRGLKEGDLEKSQLGLGHSYSRSKLKFNVNRADNMIIQAICLLDQLEKDINTFSMRIKEWYSWHFPELATLVSDNSKYASCAKLIGNKANANEELIPELTEITDDPELAKQILESTRTSMGYEISDFDIINIRTFADKVCSLMAYKKRLHEYLTKKMNDVAPNLASLIGEIVGARLISHAGSLTNLAKCPASTVQILGAEKALFRALKTRGNTPKYGLIYHSSFIGRAGAKNKGRISRCLANKATIASRIDCFSDSPTTRFGDVMREQVEERLKYYDTGEAPRKNIDCMQGVISSLDEVEEEPAEEEQTEKPKKKSVETPKTRKKKSKKRDSAQMDADEDVVQDPPTKKKKASSTPTTEKKKKKKKKKADK